MKKRIIHLLFALILFLNLTAPAMAENRNGVYVLDEKEYLTESECQFYQIQAEELSDELDMDILYVQTYATDLQTDAQSLNLGSRPNQIMLLDNNGTCDIALFGTAEALPQEYIQQLLDAYSLEPTYSEGVAAYLAEAEKIVADLNNSGVFEQQVEAVQPTSRVEDRAELLDAADEEILLSQLEEISQRQQLDVVVVTVNSLDGKSPMDYADDFFDYNGYGFGENHDGILLLVSMEQRDWWISTSGYGITAFTDAGLEYISECVVPKLSKGQYAKAFEIFAEKCDDFITQARTGVPYDLGHMPKEPFRFGLCLFISAFIGLFAAGCVVWSLQRQLQSVHSKTDAKDYSGAVTPRLTTNTETYLYSTMSSRPRFKPNLDEYSGSRSSGSFRGSSGGGSTTHRSSSGRSHGGRGGKF
jgi:uncharacterized protein